MLWPVKFSNLRCLTENGVKIITEKLTMGEFKALAGQTFGDMIKGVVDVEQNILALDAELHSDLEAFLLERGSRQKNLWGINLYPDERENFIEFDSMINVRPTQENFSRGVESEQIRQKIVGVVNKLVES